MRISRHEQHRVQPQKPNDRWITDPQGDACASFRRQPQRRAMRTHQHSTSRPQRHPRNGMGPIARHLERRQSRTDGYLPEVPQGDGVVSRPRAQVNVLFDEYKRLSDENARLRKALEIIVNGATRTIGEDSGGWALVNVRQAMLNAGRDVL